MVLRVKKRKGRKKGERLGEGEFRRVENGDNGGKTIYIYITSGLSVGSTSDCHISKGVLFSAQVLSPRWFICSFHVPQ